MNVIYFISNVKKKQLQKNEDTILNLKKEINKYSKKINYEQFLLNK